jgi:hypothetical protein
VVWTGDDRTNLPEAYAAVASGAQVQAPFELLMRWGNGAIKVGWADRTAGADENAAEPCTRKSAAAIAPDYC